MTRSVWVRLIRICTAQRIAIEGDHEQAADIYSEALQIM
jgi:hypothetical protein